MQLTSPVFSDGSPIPSKFTCEGQNINPPLQILGTPIEARSLCLLVEDPDSVSGNFTHWILYDFDPKTSLIRENWIPEICRQGKNNFGQFAYGGPCPAQGNHRYIFNIYALDKKIDEPIEAATRLQSLIAGHVLASAQLTGTYQKQNI